jgi:hypothetical protein
MLSSRMDEISVSSEGSRAAGCGLRSSLHMRGGGVSCPKRTEGPTTRPKGPKRRLAIELISRAVLVAEFCWTHITDTRPWWCAPRAPPLQFVRVKGARAVLARDLLLTTATA